MQVHSVADLLLRLESLTGKRSGQKGREILQIDSPNAESAHREELLSLVEAFQNAGKIGRVTTSLSGERDYAIIAAVTEPGCIREEDITAITKLGASARLLKIR